MTEYLSGVYAAVLTPRTEDGSVDEASFVRQISFLSTDSIAGYAINGATGEFPITTVREAGQIVALARTTSPKHRLLCGIGGPSVMTTCAYASAAIDAGADALLLPMPYFFPYRQDDLLEYVGAVLRRLDAPVLLYNLPQFTTGLDVHSVLMLMERYPQIVGIKDSSGSLDIVRALTERGMKQARLIGNDRVLADALRADVCTGVVSGVASVLPELVVALFESLPTAPKFEPIAALLEQYIACINGLPTPWGLKVTSAVRKVSGGTFPMPLSGQRQLEAEALEAWFLPWLSQMNQVLQQDHAGSAR